MRQSTSSLPGDDVPLMRHPLDRLTLAILTEEESDTSWGPDHGVIARLVAERFREAIAARRAKRTPITDDLEALAALSGAKLEAVCLRRVIACVS